jgi:hypothetical protein
VLERLFLGMLLPTAEFALLTLPNLVASHGDGTLRSKFEEFGQVQRKYSLASHSVNDPY